MPTTSCLVIILSLKISLNKVLPSWTIRHFHTIQNTLSTHPRGVRLHLEPIVRSPHLTFLHLRYLPSHHMAAQTMNPIKVKSLQRGIYLSDSKVPRSKTKSMENPPSNPAPILSNNLRHEHKFRLDIKLEQEIKCAQVLPSTNYRLKLRDWRGLEKRILSCGLTCTYVPTVPNCRLCGLLNFTTVTDKHTQVPNDTIPRRSSNTF